MTKFVQRGALGLIIAALLGCGGEVLDGYNQPLDLGEPGAVSEGMVYLDQNFDELVMVRPGLEEDVPTLDVIRVEAGDGAARMVASADGRELYVLNDGERSLSIFEIESQEIGRVDLELDTTYDVINVDPHGEFVILSNSGNRRDDAIVQNLNEVAIVDLRDPDPSVRFLSLVTRAQNLEFLPPFTLDGQEERLVVALADSQVTLVDLNAEAGADQQRRIPLTISQADQVRRPQQVVFEQYQSEGSERVSLFVVTDNDSDITEITIQPAIREAQTLKFDLSVNQLAAGNRPGRIAMVETRQGRRLLALDSSAATFTMVDVVSGESATFDLRIGSPATNLIIYEVPVPGEEILEPRILAYSPQSSLVAIIRPDAIALGTETPTTGQAVQNIRLTTSTPSRVVLDPRPESGRAIVFHAGSNDGFTILNLESLTEAPIQGFPLRDVLFDGGQAFGLFANASYLVRINLNEAYAREIELPARPQSLHLGPDGETLLVRHEGASGRFTVMPVTEPTAEKSRVFEQVFLRNVLDRPVYEEQ